MDALVHVALPGQAWNVVADDPAGLLFVISYGSNPLETALTAVDRTGRVEWQRAFPGTGRPWARATGRGTVWVSRHGVRHPRWWDRLPYVRARSIGRATRDAPPSARRCA
jgi:hypothetical protein